MIEAAFSKNCLRRVFPALLMTGLCAGLSGSALPAFFIRHQASGSGPAGYLLRSPDLAAFFTPSGAVFEARRERFELRFLGAQPQPAIEAIQRLPGKVNYLAGSRPEGWKTEIPTYGAIVYRKLYPGIDLLYEVSQARLKSEFRVAAGADPGQIRWRYEGASAPRVSPDGGLVLAAEGGELMEHKPVLYQETDGRRVAVEGGFRVLQDGSAGFRVGLYDRSRALVIDPVLSYSTYLGGGGLDWARAMAVDASGNAYVAGYTDSSDFPLANPYQASRRGGVDAFVAKLNPAGSALVYCTYLGGSYDDRAFGVAVDSAGNAYLTGWTYSANFPTTSGARQRALGGGRDAFVTKLNAAGNALVYSTYVGGGSHDSGNAIAVDASGNAYIAGDTYSTNFPVLNGFRSSTGGSQDAFAARLNAAGSRFVWSTYLGGNGNESATALALDAAGNVHLTGGTTSSNFPTYQALQGASGGGQDAFVTKLSSSGSTLLFSTYLGGSGGTPGANEMGMGIQVDEGGNTYVAGITSSPNFPLASALQTAHAGGVLDGFAAKLNSAGSVLGFSTYLGGAGVDYVSGLWVAPSGTTTVAGYTSSSNFPVTGAVQGAKAGSYDGFVARLSPAGNTLETSTYWGGSGSETISAVATDRAGNTWIAGQSLSGNLPLKGPIQAYNPGGYSAFVAKIADLAPVAGFRANDGTVRLFTYSNTLLRNAGGFVNSDVATAQLPSGDTFVVARTPSNQIWLNTYLNDTQSWRNWIYGGSPLYGNPAVAAMVDGSAYVVARDSVSAYWISRYQVGTGFQGWTALGGQFASEPSAAGAADGSVYIAATDSAGVVWTGRYTAGTGFLGWASGGSPGSVLATGRPAITVGSDQAAYVATRASDNTLWAARVQGSTWGAWSAGASNLATDPSLAASAGVIYALVISSSGPTTVSPLAEGDAGAWQSPVSTGGYLSDGAIAASYGRFFVVGRDSVGAVWWYESAGAHWIFYGYVGVVAGQLASAPR